MSTQDWTAIPLKLKAAGFTVFFERVSYEPTNPLWIAKAQREGKKWNTFGRDLESALVELEKQAQADTDDWRDISKDA